MLGLLLSWSLPAQAEQQLREYEVAPFSVAVQAKMAVKVLALDSPAGFAAATLLPPDIAGLDLIQISWPRSKQVCVLGVAMTGMHYGQSEVNAATFLTLGVGEAEPQLIPLPPELAGAMVSRVCAWPVSSAEVSDLVFLVSLVGMDLDTPVIGFQLAPDGSVSTVDTGKALTLFGWFDARDLDDSGSFELITSRSLDGVPGGFFYHAVRTYDPVTKSYVPQPDSFRAYFERELAWLSWVVDTRELIQADPTGSLGKSETGAVYLAEYEGVQFIFDSIIEVPPGTPNIGDVDEYNRQCRRAFDLVRKYRDELRAWLEGGSYPATWKLPK